MLVYTGSTTDSTGDRRRHPHSRKDQKSFPLRIGHTSSHSGKKERKREREKEKKREREKKRVCTESTTGSKHGIQRWADSREAQRSSLLRTGPTALRSLGRSPPFSSRLSLLSSCPLLSLFSLPQDGTGSTIGPGSGRTSQSRSRKDPDGTLHRTVPIALHRETTKKKKTQQPPRRREREKRERRAAVPVTI